MPNLLLTLMLGGHSETYSIQTESQSVLMLGSPVSMAAVEVSEGGVQLRATHGYTIFPAEGEPVAKVALRQDAEAIFALGSTQDQIPLPVCEQQLGAVLYSRPSSQGSRQYKKLGFSVDADVLIGRSPTAHWHYDSHYVSSSHARLTLVGEDFSITDLGSANGTFVNGEILTPHVSSSLAYGDVVTILDLTFMVGHRFIALNQPIGFRCGEIVGARFIDHETFKELCPPASETSDELPLFFPAPRLAHTIHSKTFQIDDPPAMKKPDNRPAIMQIGPSFMMGIASVFSAATAIQRLSQGGDVMSCLPSLAMCVAMLSGMVIWPLISQHYTKRRDAEEERRRQARYTDYLNGMEARFRKECDTQAEILRIGRTSVTDLEQRAEILSPSLMNRSAYHDDFMELRVGVGSCALKADFHWPQQRFSLDNDKLLDNVEMLAKNPPKVIDVPLAFNPVQHFIAGILGPRSDVWSFARGLVIQACSFYGYQDVKLVLIADKKEEAEWSFMRALPHLFDDLGQRRFLACDYDGLAELSMQLERVLEQRLDIKMDKVGDYGSYYLIFCANKRLAERSDTIDRLTSLRTNKGFSLIFFGEELKDLPRECDYVIDLSYQGILSTIEGSTQILGDTVKDGSAHMFDRGDVAGSIVSFNPDSMVSRESAHTFALNLSRVHLDMPSAHNKMPSSLGFLEMFEVGNVAQLNIAKRWAEGDASRTLQTPVGRDAQAELSLLNLHENVHGPHGLIAGTTGSGKSEFLITYILSMCVNYSPDQVAFVLIDYKGGGLAGAFENERLSLPHLAGMLTNLDGATISRSLISIKSELKRRQAILAEACKITGEATMDIYKYLRYYQAGTLLEALPHLFIVADEFAELKQQEPEFMDELISAARIGRSLGVHLILATQKPTGVVNDQIWSNSRFKVCLKVADAADSKEMIRRPDAAEIKEPGRFYLLVGYDELFTGGQASYAGGSYAPTEEFEPKRDDAVELVDDTADIITSLRPPRKTAAQDTSELNAILAQISATAHSQAKAARHLWLEVLPSHISLASLRERYCFKPHAESILVALGEVDDPEHQSQFLYTVELAHCGNILFYGSQNSGVDGLVSTLLYSLTQDYSANQVSYYVIDLGTGSLSPYAAAPQCGGVVLAGDTERVDNLFRLLQHEIETRRKLLSSEGCNFKEYNSSHPDKTLGNIVVALANLAAFYDLYPSYEETLVMLTRDAPRYGIYFAMSASSASVPRMRLRANIATHIICSLNDESDLITILGRKPSTIVPRQDKRGYVTIGKSSYEFQGASVGEAGQTEASLISQLARRVTTASSEQAHPIPALPSVVHHHDMDLLPIAGNNLPVGFNRQTVESVSVSLTSHPTMLILGNDMNSIARYLRGIRECLEIADEDYLFIDSGLYLGVLHDRRVLQEQDDISLALTAIAAGRKTVSLLVFSSIIETLAALPDEPGRLFKTYIEKEQGRGITSIVAATEFWRGKSLYDLWYKVLTAHGNGVWVGSGFSEQTFFRFPRMLSEYRMPARRDDGFLALRGDVIPVRLVSSSDELKDDE